MYTRRQSRLSEPLRPPVTRRTLVSLFIAWHMTAVFVAVIPSANAIAPPYSVQPSGGSRLPAWVAPRLDALARNVDWMLPHIRAVTAPIRLLTTPYLNTLGFDEQWVMFANPNRTDQYVRVRYFVHASNTGVSRTVTELVYPAWPEYEPRGFASFRGSYQDRATNTMLERFHSDEHQPVVDATNRARESPYLPLARYFGSRFARTGLRSSEAVQRVEVWHGVAPNQPPGRDASTPAARLNLLRDYYAGLSDLLGPATASPMAAVEREIDIVWTLEYAGAP